MRSLETALAILREAGLDSPGLVGVHAAAATDEILRAFHALRAYGTPKVTCYRVLRTLALREAPPRLVALLAEYSASGDAADLPDRILIPQARKAYDLTDEEYVFARQLQSLKVFQSKSWRVLEFADSSPELGRYVTAVVRRERPPFDSNTAYDIALRHATRGDQASDVDDNWNEKVIRQLDWDEYRCRLCGKGGWPLYVHSVHDERTGSERVGKDLLTLCPACHSIATERQKERRD